jgi:hypothetical protein
VQFRFEFPILNRNSGLAAKNGGHCTPVQQLHFHGDTEVGVVSDIKQEIMIPAGDGRDHDGNCCSDSRK